MRVPSRATATVSSPPITPDRRLFSPRVDERLHAARAQGRLARRALAKRVREWPPESPAAINAWLVLVTTKPPSWRDPFVTWPEAPPTLGEAHEGFFYPDPLGFWAEIRKWALELFRLQQPEWAVAEALALTTLLHTGGNPDWLVRAMDLSSPRVVLFLDEPSWERSGLQVRQIQHHIADPHRKGQVYEGFWGETADGVVVGKAPQHPTMHNLYRWEDMAEFLRSLP